MNLENIKNECAKPAETAGLAPAPMGIPVHFSSDLPTHFPIKIQPHHLMSNSTGPAKAVTPTLFQIAARADDPESLVAFKKSLAPGREPHPEKMLDRGKLEAILDSVARRKKSTPRRAQARLEKRLSLSEGHAA